ncbi:DUF4138 domain-containing protein [Lutibacter flavus]|uniref:Bacteroides conjugative transposon TraN protein n=1 Tax=Lutibacter flavus TaxID=691689 RepID=A0A238YCT9_9FLAO|nr:DUF4138 domain-containing protein [Lutibacter flavus]SNR68792.1 protein of unknown function [Lutibacter flavus]
MKRHLSTLLLLFSLASVAQLKQQSPYKLDTIFANEEKSVALFFPNPIRQAITGAEHFVFNYNREKLQYFGLLQATPGAESNLLTITENGQVYSYILKYKKQLKKINYFISEKESVGNEKPIKIAVKKQKQIINKQGVKISQYLKFSEYLLSSTLKNIATKCKKGVKVRLQKIAYNASEVYLVIEIRNNSKIDFEIDYLNVYRTNGNKKKKASYQSLRLKEIYKHKMPSIIYKGQRRKFVYVLPKFVLGDNEKLQIELQELKGSRRVVLETKN